MAEDHGLCNGDGPIDVAESLELLLLAVADHVVLLNCVKRFLLTFQLNDVRIRNDVTLCGNHNVCLIQHKHFDFLGVDELELLAPVQDCAGGANHNLLLELHPPLHWTGDMTTSSVTFSIIGVKFAHLLDDLACLEGKLICRPFVAGIHVTEHCQDKGCSFTRA
uniref:Uncharacterized protein n=1 Tax=Pygocentrus nattereri TaxID=42514 RepID=A0A3B4D556_PYGNA